MVTLDERAGDAPQNTRGTSGTGPGVLRGCTIDEGILLLRLVAFER
ncbi:MAG: hypothetical protein ACI9TI_002408 [Natronomonas sp.]|jgi:hypothetical protein